MNSPESPREKREEDMESPAGKNQSIFEGDLSPSSSARLLSISPVSTPDRVATPDSTDSWLPVGSMAERSDFLAANSMDDLNLSLVRDDNTRCVSTRTIRPDLELRRPEAAAGSRRIQWDREELSLLSQRKSYVRGSMRKHAKVANESLGLDLVDLTTDIPYVQGIGIRILDRRTGSVRGFRSGENSKRRILVRREEKPKLSEVDQLTRKKSRYIDVMHSTDRRTSNVEPEGTRVKFEVNAQGIPTQSFHGKLLEMSRKEKVKRSMRRLEDIGKKAMGKLP
jgi:hypothetical protein